ncbi:YybH family protein [Carboxylicivirga sp. RSCT41]|uniref:YybH family protein n=1 Tax=Carboxylicivirga agarovorans TaxID=3417570 RepID=UPI003D33B7AE
MKTKLSYSKLSGIILLVIFFGASCTQPHVQQDVKADIQMANQAIMDAIKSQDVDKITAHYTADVVILPSNNEALTGIESARQMWVDGFNYGMGHLDFITEEAIAYGDIAQEHGIYKYYTPDNEMVDHGKYVVIWKKEGEQWKIAKDIWNSSLPMPPKASVKDTIALVVTKVKPDKIDALSEMATDVFLPAFNKHFPDSKATSRLFKVVNNKKGDAELIYLIDPLVKGHVHDVQTVLSSHYSEEEVSQQLKDFKSYVIKQEVIYAVPMKW